MRAGGNVGKIRCMMPIHLSVVVIDSHPLMRTALSTTLATEEGMQVIAEYASGKELFANADGLSPNMILLGISNPGVAEMETIQPLRESFPQAVILALVTGERQGQDAEALQHGAHSVLEKTISRSGLLNLLHELQGQENFNT